MAELSFYNAFFKTTHPPAIALAEKLAETQPRRSFNHASSSIPVPRPTTPSSAWSAIWASLGRPDKTVLIARKNAITARPWAAAASAA